MSRYRVAVTRPSSDRDPLVAALASRGVESRVFPLLRIVGLTDPAEALRRIGSRESHDLVTFTSRNAVLGLQALLEWSDRKRTEALDPVRSKASVIHDTDESTEATRRMPDFLERLSIAAVGEGTAGALRDRGVSVDIVPERSNAEALVEAVARYLTIEGCRVLVPCGNRARRTVPERLKQGGAEVVEVVVYHTVECEPLGGELLERALLSGEVPVVTFASGSAVESLVRAIGQDRASKALACARIACLGRSAEAALQPLGSLEVRVASASSFSSLADAAVDLLRSARG